MKYNPEDYTIDSPGEEFCTRIVVDINSRTMFAHTSRGVVREYNYSVDEFIEQLEKCRAVCDDLIYYNAPVTA